MGAGAGSRKSVLLAEDETWLRTAMAGFLVSKGWEVLQAGKASEVEALFHEERPDVVLLDFQLDDGTALDLLPRLRAVDEDTPILILTAHGSIERAVLAVKAGADQFLTKPVDLQALAGLLSKCLEGVQQRREGLATKSRLKPAAAEPFAGDSPAIRRLAEQVRKLLDTSVPILLVGETGSGKGVVARFLHANGPRASESLVDVNCAGFSRELLESELFGCEKGAFTGANARREGLLDAAHRGTLFLDEIGDLDPLVQPKLLKVLESRRFRRLGSTTERAVDVRFLFATSRRLAELVADKRFREDLYFQISTLPLEVPPLRERLEDIPALVERILAALAAELSRGRLSIEPQALDALRRYRWPGNIRELRNVLERAVLLGDGRVVSERDLQLASAPAPSGADAIVTLDENERSYLERVMGQLSGDVATAANLLRIPRSTLYFKLKRLGVGRYAEG